MIPPALPVTTMATSAAASTVAAPASLATGLGERDGLPDDDDPGQHRRPAADPGDHVPAVTAKIHRSPRRDETGDRRGGRRIAARRQPCRLPRGVEATHLQRNRDEARATQHHDGHQGGDGQCGLDGAEPAITG